MHFYTFKIFTTKAPRTPRFTKRSNNSLVFLGVTWCPWCPPRGFPAGHLGGQLFSNIKSNVIPTLHNPEAVGDEGGVGVRGVGCGVAARAMVIGESR
jgi:hypothetical protein